MQTRTKSPCVGTCTLDQASRYCIGCLRTVEEIGAWRTLTEDQRVAVIAQLKQRAINIRRVFE